MLRHKEKGGNDPIERAKSIREKHQQLQKFGGEYQVIDIDAFRHSFIYDMVNAPSSADVEEWALNIPPRSLPLLPNGFPRFTNDARSYMTSPIDYYDLTASWRRIMYD